MGFLLSLGGGEVATSILIFKIKMTYMYGIQHVQFLLSLAMHCTYLNHLPPPEKKKVRCFLTEPLRS